MDRCKWRKEIKEARWSGWVWVGECFFWYRPTRVVPDQRPLNGHCCCCCNSVLQAGHPYFAQPTVLQHFVFKAGIDFLSTTFGRLQHFLHAAAVSQKLMEDITVRYMHCISVKLTLCIEQCLALHSRVDCHLQQWSVWSILLSESGWWNIRLAQTWSLVWNPITQAHHKMTLVIDILTRHSSENMWKLTKWNFEKKKLCCHRQTLRHIILTTNAIVEDRGFTIFTRL